MDFFYGFNYNVRIFIYQFKFLDYIGFQFLSSYFVLFLNMTDLIFEYSRPRKEWIITLMWNWRMNLEANRYSAAQQHSG